ncbi:MAG: polyhydroxybutyrate depolymerase [Alphaproteobacteria bacterium]|jgi:polyhydroxybutyrate depolymerase|nr:polyhydroxybutyrate depolymerase [Alphaproteobacteria bacterium]
MQVRTILCSMVLGSLFLLSSHASADDLWRHKINGTDRTYFLHGFRKDAPLRPLVIALHGWSGDALDITRYLGMNAVADREDFLVVYPDGFARTWNYGVPVDKSPMPVARNRPLDDVFFLKSMINNLIKKAAADPARVYLTGVSYGGMMAFAAACALSNELAAVAPLITGMSEQQRADCSGKPIPLLVIAGTKDTSQTYDGEFAGPTPLLSVPDTIAFWKQHNGCSAEAGDALPHLDPADPTKVNLLRYNGCTDGAEISFYRIDGGGHQVPSISAPARDGRNRDFEGAEVLWSFFKRFSR